MSGVLCAFWTGFVSVASVRLLWLRPSLAVSRAAGLVAYPWPFLSSQAHTLLLFPPNSLDSRRDDPAVRTVVLWSFSYQAV